MEGYYNYSSFRSIKSGKFEFLDEVNDHRRVMRNLHVGLSYDDFYISSEYKNEIFDQINSF